MDTTPPTAPTLSSTTTPENRWSTTLDANGKLAFTATGTAADNASIQYWLDATGTPTTVAAGPNTAVAISLDKPATGQHARPVHAKRGHRRKHDGPGSLPLLLR